MKIRLIFGVLLLMAAATVARAEDSLPAMEARFLAQFKTAIAHQDFALFARLLDNDGPANAEQAREFAGIEPYRLIFSNLARTYQFGPPGDCAPGTPGLSITKIHGAMLSRIAENSPVIAVLTVNFPDRPPKSIPVARPANASPDWTPPPPVVVVSGGSIPLVEKDGRLLIVNAGWNGNGPVPTAME